MKTATRIIFFFLLALCFSAFPQPEILPLHGNAALTEHAKKIAAIQNYSQRASSVNDTVYLPFYDEFSYAGPWPDANKWQNSQSIFVNHTYPKAPPTLGVATF